MNIFQMGTTASVSVLMLCAQTEAADIFGLDLRLANEFFTTTTDDFVGNFSIIGGVLYDSFAMDLDLTATTLHAVLFDGLNTYGTIDVTTGAFTPSGTLVGVLATDNVTGLSVDPISGDWYLSALDAALLVTLYVGDITTGVFTPVGLIGAGLNIDLAIDSQGNAYGHDIATAELLSINLVTGAGTAIGPTGQAANFAQGMDFDYSTDTLYATMYTGDGTGSFGFFDLNTGLFNVLQDTLVLNSEMEMVVVGTICPWDCADPVDGTVGTADLLALLASWGGAGPCDFDGGGVRTSDLLKLLANWGDCP